MKLKLSITRGWGIVTVALCAGVLASCGAVAEQAPSAPVASAPAASAEPVAAVKAVAVATGLQVGDKVLPFDVEDITGPKKGKQLCYV